VPKTVVDGLEPVEVEEHHGDLAPGPGGAAQRQLQPVGEQRAVGQAGQPVGEGQLRELGLGAPAGAALPAVGDPRGDGGGGRADREVRRHLLPADREVGGDQHAGEDERQQCGPVPACGGWCRSVVHGGGLPSGVRHLTASAPRRPPLRRCRARTTPTGEPGQAPRSAAIRPWTLQRLEGRGRDRHHSRRAVCAGPTVGSIEP
jgi:hypothetical protein